MVFSVLQRNAHVRLQVREKGVRLSLLGLAVLRLDHFGAEEEAELKLKCVCVCVCVLKESDANSSVPR